MIDKTASIASNIKVKIVTMLLPKGQNTTGILQQQA